MRDFMNPFPCQGIEISRQCRHKHLPLSHLHLRNAPIVKHSTTNYRDVKMSHPQAPASSSLPHAPRQTPAWTSASVSPRARRERNSAVFAFSCAGHLFVGEPPKRRLESVDSVHEAAVIPQHPGVEAA
uniref:Uncharacterized protein n=1 Tax=Arundo donax TaxID=35708 RepID=A0A0A9H3W7_ARUDO